jgi:hypothetical protein
MQRLQNQLLSIPPQQLTATERAHSTKTRSPTLKRGNAKSKRKNEPETTQIV